MRHIHTESPVDTVAHAQATPSAVVLERASDWPAAVETRMRSGGHLAPVIDLTGRFSDEADCIDPGEQERVVAAFHGRRQTLSASVQLSTQPEIRLLAYLYVSGRPLTARYAPDTKEAIGYGKLCPIINVRKLAEELADSGYLTRRLFDRVHVCDRCGSSRLNVREECPSCRSPHLSTVTLLHHLRCAYQGPEHDFRAADGHLICPKCARELRHYGSDYERSGTVQECQDCRHVGSDPSVGFVCMDCSAHFDGEAVRCIDFHHYDLSEAGIELLRRPHQDERDETAVSLSGLPLELRARLIALASEPKAPHVLCELSYLRERWVVHQHGPDAFDRARQHLLDDLRARLGPSGFVNQGRAYDYVLLNGSVANEETLEDHIRQSTRQLAIDLGVAFTGLRCSDLMNRKR